MNRKEAKKILPILTAFVEGKNIQVFTNTGIWVDSDDISLYNLGSWPEGYRIKPEPTYRPFKDADECWQEMLNHQPFGWIKSKDKGYFHLVGLVQWSSELEDVMITFATSEQLARSSRSLFEDFTFADGTPFGIREE